MQLQRPEPATPLPLLRRELEFFEGPQSKTGAPTFTLYDPLARSFDKLSWAEAIILQSLKNPMTLGQLHDALTRETTLRISPEELLAFCKDVERRGLTDAAQIRPVEELLREAQGRKVHPFKWILHNYLYFRVPLLHPDKFLEKTLPYMRAFATPNALYAYIGIFLFGAFLTMQRFEDYLATFPYFYNLPGLIVFSASVVLLKVIHEFSHAYTAKAFGVRIPVMGVAFIVLWPVAFCDVTDGWRLADRKKRLLISTAGVMAEFVVAGIALLCWAMTKPGIMNSIFFVVSSSSLLSTILVNTNPSMRFDGYYILMDLWGIDNLQARAFAATRWFYKKWLLGINLPYPEPETFSRRRLIGFVTYSVYTWLYRLALYTGIAVFVYYKFTKIVGILLFSVEVWWFIARPILRELVSLRHIKGGFAINKRLLTTLVVLSLVFAWLIIPTSHRFSAPAVAIATKSQTLYIPHPGVVRVFEAKRGEHIPTGKLILGVDSKQLDDAIALVEVEKRILEQEKEINLLSQEHAALVPELLEKIAQTGARLQGLYHQKAQNEVVSTVAGTAYDWDDTLQAGRFVRQNEIVGRIAVPKDLTILAFVAEDMVSDIKRGAVGIFFSNASPTPLHAVVMSVSPVRAETIAHAALTSLAMGDLPVVKDATGKYVILESFYMVEMRFLTPDERLRFGQSGKVWLQSEPRSMLLDFLRQAYRVAIRESSF